MVDPRIETGDITVNEALLNSSIRRAVSLHLLSNDEVRRVVGFLNDETFPRIRARLFDRLAAIEHRGHDIGPATTADLQALSGEIRGILSEGAQRIVADQTERLVRIGLKESEFVVATTMKAIPKVVRALDPVMFNLGNGLDATAIRRIIDTKPMAGGLMREWWTGSTATWGNAIDRVVKSGAVEGRSTSAIVADALGFAGAPNGASVARTIRTNAEAIVRPMITNISSQVQEEIATENDDIVSGLQWLATLDSATCPKCQGLDGQVFPINEGPRPPAHLGICRCRMTLVIKSLKEMGLGKAETSSLPSGVRASMAGDVPESTTYYDWLKNQSATVQNEALGPARADLFRAGTVSGSDLTDDRGRLVTLDQLESTKH